MRTPRLVPLAGGAAVLAMLAACSTSPSVPVSVTVPPPTVVSQPAPVVAAPGTPVASLEYGRVVNIDHYAGGTARTAPSVPGAIIGGVAGALIGNQIGGGSGRTAATVLGGAAGAAVGSQVGRGATTVTEPVYRVTVQTDQGLMRYYDVPATGDLRVGDRVRVENGVIYRG